ncbi:MAG: trimethylamine methyltransferase family protein [Gammaproteobacteria bacterium]|nr:trimethylamine methyltransferase family protein [Gammaproteobacteria bacterium]
MIESRRRERQRRQRPSEAKIDQLPFEQVENPFSPIDILSEDQLNRIHHASLDVLEEIGINFLLDEAREILSIAGADVEKNSTRVRFDRNLILESIANAPSEFTIHARNPQRNLKIGGRWLAFSTVAGPPNASDIQGGRRSGNFKDYSDFIKLAQSVNIAHVISGHPVEPLDLDPKTRHLDTARVNLTLTDKVCRVYSLGRDRVMDSLEITRICHSLSREELAHRPSLYTVVNVNSPLQYDIPMLWGIIELARMNQVVVITPFTLAGAMAPITLAGAVTQQNAEALAGLAFSQIVNPGAPVMYGGFTSNVDMKTGSPAFGTPEYVKATLMGGQFARFYNLPYRSSNVNASNAPDVQATYESQMSIWGSVMARANLIHHALGWLEGGLCASFEKFVMDAEMLQGVVETLKPVVVDEDTLGVEAMREVGPGGHYFAAQQTMERYETEFYKPILSDWRNFETWFEDGAKDATTRANQIYQQLLSEYEAPKVDEAILQELDEYIEITRMERRKAPV